MKRLLFPFSCQALKTVLNLERKELSAPDKVTLLLSSNSNSSSSNNKEAEQQGTGGDITQLGP